ncbi:MAG: hypothetical protein RLZZ312_337 [Bacteroidota bacterium]
MALPNVFEKSVTDIISNRIQNLNLTTQPIWGKMNVSQMLAHSNVVYEMIFDDKHKKPNAFLSFILKLVVKKNIVSEKPYKQNGGTAPQFIIADNRDFELEKSRLIQYINKVQELGESHFDNRESHSFGKLSKTEWNNMFYKHLDHHLSQFGL